MHRRDFLKLGGLISTALLVQFSSLGSFAVRPVEAESDGMRYRGTSDGKILVSPNAGKTWHLHTDFGSGFSVLSLAADFSGQVQAQLGFEMHSFELALAQNGKTWRTG